MKLSEKSRLIKTLKQKERRGKTKIGSLQELFSSLKKKNLICEGVSEVLQRVSGPNKNIIERQIFKSTSTTLPKTYDLEIKSFALNLNFLSARAYEYVRTSFSNCLPHSRTIQSWYQRVGCNPGLTKESFSAIKKAAEASQNKIVVNLVFDEMHIMQHIDWDGENSHGFVDIGDGGNSDIVATQILVFLAVCVNQSWKIPLGLFPIASLNAEQKANMTTLCVRALLDCGVEVLGITFDGAATNLTMSKLLGSDVRDANSKGYINIDGTEDKIVLHPDPCHMIKLVRNTLGDWKIFIDGEGRQIKWHYLVLLQELQEKEGLHLRNKLRKAHIYFQKQKMKVRLAVQSMSKSVADAIDFCREVLQLREFDGSEGTSNFIRIFNDIFDILNSRKIQEPELKKKALCENNASFILEYSEEAIEYINALKLPSGIFLVNSRRNVGFVGLIAALRNMSVLYKRFIETGILKFIPLYKTNQDPIELFFAAVRMGLGHNNNPTVKQFIARYKKLLFRCQLRDGGIGNCLPLEQIALLNVGNVDPLQEINSTVDRTTMLDPVSVSDFGVLDQKFLDDHGYASDPAKLTDYARHVIEYIAGFVVFKICQTLHCTQCTEALQGDFSPLSLINYKTRGFLKVPSKSVVEICLKAEKELRVTKHLSDENLLHKNNFQKLCNSVQSHFIGKELFVENSTHMTSTIHYSRLLKLITERYLRTRYYFLAKQTSEKISIRQQFNKLVHFNGM